MAKSPEYLTGAEIAFKLSGLVTAAKHPCQTLDTVKRILENSKKDDDIGYLLCGSLFLGVYLFSLAVILVVVSDINPIYVPFLCIPVAMLTGCHHLMLGYLTIVNQYAPYRCLGRSGKLLLKVITLFPALAMRQLLDYNLFHLAVLTGFTADAHVFFRVWHVAYDISVCDVFLELILQILLYTLYGETYLFLVVFVLVCCLLLYQYVTYSPPPIPVFDGKKDLESQPC